MIIINSGAYVIPEFQVEIGKLPPCLLPVANRKLVEHQVEIINKYFDEDIYISLPDDYKLSHDEELLFIDLNVKVIKTNASFRLAEAILYLLNITHSELDEPVRLLHGDTLLMEYPKDKLDCLGIGTTAYNYTWESESQNSKNKSLEVWCGYFSFSDKMMLIKSLALARGNFVVAVRNYRDLKDLKSHYFEDWYDFGHINTYFQSRAKLTTERAFNSLEIKNNILRKTGSPARKIEAEALWLQDIPNQLKVYSPQLLSHGTLDSNYFYNIEYLSIMPLNELFVHGKKPAKDWSFIFDKIFAFIYEAANTELNASNLRSIEADFKGLVIDKTYYRINQYSIDKNFELDNELLCNGIVSPSIREIVNACSLKILQLESLPGVIHGDLCLSNILFDSRSEQIKLIDPRGLNFSNDITFLGDQKYDLAKLAHSIIGLYDLIISDRFAYSEVTNYEFSLGFYLDNEVIEIQNILLDFEFKGVIIRDIVPLVILLFISMLPLHNDREDRQKAMLANAVRLYIEYMK